MRHVYLYLSIALIAGATSFTATSGKAAGKVDLQGAGATFPYPLYSKWLSEYQKVEPAVQINYQSIGSGGGIRQITSRTVDFGASDAPMSDAELGKARGKILHLPMTLGSVVVTYNVPGVARIKLSPAAISSLFLGEIKSWDDPVLAKLNPGVVLPKKPVTVVFRSDGSGTTAVFTEYLATVSPAWKEKVGAGKSVRFPSGLGAKGNEGVAGQVRTSPGAIGYVELAYAKQTGLAYALLQNRAGEFVEPTAEAISAAAADVKLPDDLRVSIVDPPGKAAYPIAAFTYILAYEEQDDEKKGRALAEFLLWAVHEGQAFGKPLHYAPLPPAVITKVESALGRLRHGGRALLGKK